MDPLTYIRKVLALLRQKTYRSYFLRIGPEGEEVEISYLVPLEESDAGEGDEYATALEAPDLPALAAKIPAFLAQYGIDFPSPK